jgi:hypothetical protein
MKALREGQYISHFKYGLGVVIESDDDRTSIDFDNHGPKKFVTGLMVVESSDLEPPKRKRAKRTGKASASSRTAKKVKEAPAAGKSAAQAK